MRDACPQKFVPVIFFSQNNNIMNWIIVSVVAAVAIFVVLGQDTGLTLGLKKIKCYTCNSYFQADCGDWFNNRTFNLVECDPGVIKCRKVVQEVYYNDEWDVRYVRQCAPVGDIGSDEGRHCKERTGTYRVKLRYCHCDNQDGCNSAGHVKMSTMAVLLPAVSTIAAVLFRYL